MPSLTGRTLPAVADWTLADAEAALDATTTAAAGVDGAAKNAALVEDGDHWRAGADWPGPRGTAEQWGAMRSQVERQFTPVPATEEAVTNVANGLLRTEPDVTFVPLIPAKQGTNEEQQQQTEIAAMRAAVSGWWDRVALWELARAAVRRGTWAGYGTLRVWVPAAELVEAVVGSGDTATTVRTLPTLATDADAFERVALSAPVPADACVYVHPRTQERCALYRSTDDDGNTSVEVWTVDRSTRETVVRVLRSNAAPNDPPHAEDLAGRLPIAAAAMGVLVTDCVRRLQCVLDYVSSLLPRSAEMSAFLERTTLDAEDEYDWFETAPASGPRIKMTDDDGRVLYGHRKVRTVGAGYITNLVGKNFDGPNGSTIHASPSIVYHEPTDPGFVTGPARALRRTLLEACAQGHLAHDSTAEASGIAYQQARAAHEADLDNRRAPVEGMVRDTIGVAIAYAGRMHPAGLAAGFLTRYRVAVTLRVSAGPITPDEKRAAAEMRTAGLLSRTGAMAAIGVEDTAAEMDAIDAEPGAKLATAKAEGETLAVLTSVGGVGLPEAAAFAGIDPARAAVLVGAGPVVVQ
jgi:hypothetical protein